MKILKITSLAAILLLGGCASIVRSQSAANQTYSSVQSIDAKRLSIGEIEQGAGRNLRISLESPFLNSDQAEGRFEVVTLSGKKGDEYSISLTSLCDCLGFKKWVVVPRPFLQDGHGQIIGQWRHVNQDVQRSTGVFQENGPYYLLIVADSTSEGKKVGDIYGSIAGGGLLSGFVLDMSEVSHPTGIVRIDYEESSRAGAASKP